MHPYYDGQLHRSTLCKQIGWDKISEFKRHYTRCHILVRTRYFKCCCRSPVQVESRSRQLETMTGLFLAPNMFVEPTDRLIRGSFVSSAGPVHQLASSTESDGGGRIHTELRRNCGKIDGLCVSAIQTLSLMLKDLEELNGHASADASLASTTLMANDNTKYTDRLLF